MQIRQIESPAEPVMMSLEIDAALDDYRRQLREWIDQRPGNDSSLDLASQALCAAAAARGVPPEQLLIALHAGCVMPFWSSAGAGNDAARETRYRSAIRLLLRTYFGIQSTRVATTEQGR